MKWIPDMTAMTHFLKSFTRSHFDHPMRPSGVALSLTLLLLLGGAACFQVEAQPFSGQDGASQGQERFNGGGFRGKGGGQRFGGARPNRRDAEGGSFQKGQAGQERGGAMSFLKDLNLSEEQREKLKTMMQEGREKNHALREKSKGRYRAMMDYMADPAATEAKALEMQRDIQADQAKMSELRIQSWFKMRSVLTPEQLQQVQAKFKEHQTKMEAFHERRKNWQEQRQNSGQNHGANQFGEHPPRPNGLMLPPPHEDGPPPEGGLP
jgi:Spy/CpxP family protein refolding chaperone